MKSRKIVCMILFIATMLTGCSFNIKATQPSEKRQRRVQDLDGGNLEVLENTETEEMNLKTIDLFKGDKIQEFVLTDKDDVEFKFGQKFTKKTILSFFVSWNEDVKSRINNIDNRIDSTEAELVIVNLTELENISPIEIAKEFETKNKILLFDLEGKVSKLYNISAIPTTYLIDEDGIIVDILGNVSKEEEIKIINEFLQD